jgi:hypothetical protein
LAKHWYNSGIICLSFACLTRTARQEVFVKIQKRPGKLEGWIYLIARNAVIDYYRTRKETVEVPGQTR